MITYITFLDIGKSFPDPIKQALALPSGRDAARNGLDTGVWCSYRQNRLRCLHILALEATQSGEGRIYNLGNGSGYSVREVIRTAERIVGKPIPHDETPRRPGDPATLVASSEKISRELGWQPQFPSLQAIIETAWNWHRDHPDGYGT